MIMIIMNIIMIILQHPPTKHFLTPSWGDRHCPLPHYDDDRHRPPHHYDHHDHHHDHHHLTTRSGGLKWLNWTTNCTHKTLSNTQEEIVVDIIVVMPILLGKWYKPCVLSNHWSMVSNYLILPTCCRWRTIARLRGVFQASSSWGWL